MMKQNKESFPEHEKLSKVKEQSQWLGSFIEWCQNKGYSLRHWEETEEREGWWYPVTQSIEQLLSEHLEIDLKKIEEEKQQMLNEIRELNKIQ